jgi:nucleoid-associated protein YgaU
MLAENTHAIHDDSLTFEGEGIEAELAFLTAMLDSAEMPSAAELACVELVSEALEDQAPRERYRVAGPAMVKVAAIGLATFPAALSPMPAFANEPMPENMMIALAQRPDAPPGLGATGAQLFPFSRPMMNLRNQVAAAAPHEAAKATTHVASAHAATHAKGPHVTTKRFALNPKLTSLFKESRQVAVTSKRGAAATFYQVGKGDSLYSIAADLLGSGSRWREIYGANQQAVAHGYLLKVGQRLVIPSSRPATFSEPVHLAAAPKAMPQNSPSSKTKTYRVTPGDSLYTIAAKRLGNASRWREIVAINKAALQGRTVIYPNQWLTLPVHNG